MSVFFSKECEYAIQAVLYLAQKQENELTPIKEISARINIPQPFLAKIFQKLSGENILKSVKGVSGGFTLAKSPNDVVLYDIVRSIDGTESLTSCVLGFAECGNETPCPLHSEWKILREQLRNTLTSKNILDLTKHLRKKGYAVQ